MELSNSTSEGLNVGVVSRGDESRQEVSEVNNPNINYIQKEEVLPLSSEDYKRKTATELAVMVKEGKVTPEQLIELAFVEIEEQEPILNALVNDKREISKEILAKGKSILAGDKNVLDIGVLNAPKELKIAKDLELEFILGKTVSEKKKVEVLSELTVDSRKEIVSSSESSLAKVDAKSSSGAKALPKTSAVKKDFDKSKYILFASLLGIFSSVVFRRKFKK